MKETRKDAEWRRDGKNFRLYDWENDITCPICELGKLVIQRRKEWKCTICQRWFEEFGT